MFSPKQQLKAQLSQKLCMHISLQKALHILEMPVQELRSWLEHEIETNPALDFELSSISTPTSPEVQQYQQPLGEHLMEQARELIHSRKSLEILEKLIGCIEKSGLLPLEIEELARICNATREQVLRCLKILKTFDPPGIGAKNLQECLLIQLRLKRKENTLTYRVIEKHFDELIHGRFLTLQKILTKSPYEIQKTLQKDLRELSYQPAQCFQHSPSQNITPDVLIEKDDTTWKVKVYQSQLPKLALKEFDADGKKLMKTFIANAKALCTGLERRKQTLQKIAIVLVNQQRPFFDGIATLTPLDTKEIAKSLSIHESTLFRAIAGKYVETPKGILPLKVFFEKTTFKKSSQDISRSSALEVLKKLIEEEDKTNPLSDQQLVEKLREKNFPCARRTVTKYRKKLAIGSTRQRRQFAKDGSISFPSVFKKVSASIPRTRAVTTASIVRPPLLFRTSPSSFKNPTGRGFRAGLGGTAIINSYDK